MARSAAIALATILAVAGVVAAASEPPLLLPGTYRLDVRLATQADVPVLGKSRSSWESVAVATIRRRNGRLVQTHHPCDARIRSGFPGVRVTVSPAFVSALASPSYPLDLRDGWYRADLGVEYVGYLPRGTGASLPRAATDPGVFDWDHDGKPGATLILSLPMMVAGEIQIVQRGRSILEGHVVSPDRAAGHVAMPVFEQAVIAAHPAAFEGTASLRPDPERSLFLLTRIADDSTCASLRLDDDSVDDAIRAAKTD